MVSSLMRKEYTLPLLAAIMLCGCSRQALPTTSQATVPATSAQVALPGAHPLSIASRDAAYACSKVDAWSIDDCGTAMPGNTAEHKAARTASLKAFHARDAFMNECQARETLAHCTADAEMHIMRGYALVTE